MASEGKKGGMRVLVVDETPGRVAILERALADCGHQVVARVATSEDLFARVAEVQPDVIIIDLDSPDRDTLEHMRGISRDQPRPVVMFAEDDDSGTIQKAIQAGVSAYVVDGLSPHRIKPLLEVAIARFREYQALRDELEATRNTLAERKVIERAKGVLMRQKGMDEEAAYQALRRAAMDQNLRLGQVARNLVAAAELLGS